MFSVSITTFNRQRKQRDNYFNESLFSLIDCGLFKHPLISSVDIFVGHEQDEWCKLNMPDNIPVHYLDSELPHTDNIMAVLKHAANDHNSKYHLYLEDDIIPLVDNVFDEIWNFQMNKVPNPEAFSVFLDSRPQDAAMFPKGYREEGLNTFTAVMLFKDRIRDFTARFENGFPQCKAPDHFFGKACMQPTFTKVPGLFKHIGLQSAAHKRCFDKVLGEIYGK